MSKNFLSCSERWPRIRQTLMFNFCSPPPYFGLYTNDLFRLISVTTFGHCLTS